MKRRDVDMIPRRDRRPTVARQRAIRHAAEPATPAITTTATTATADRS